MLKPLKLQRFDDLVSIDICGWRLEISIPRTLFSFCYLFLPCTSYDSLYFLLLVHQFRFIFLLKQLKIFIGILFILIIDITNDGVYSRKTSFFFLHIFDCITFLYSNIYSYVKRELWGAFVLHVSVPRGWSIGLQTSQNSWGDCLMAVMIRK